MIESMPLAFADAVCLQRVIVLKSAAVELAQAHALNRYRTFDGQGSACEDCRANARLLWADYQRLLHIDWSTPEAG